VASLVEFIAKVDLCPLYFDPARRIAKLRGLTSGGMIHQLAHQRTLDICLLPLVNLDYRLHPQGDPMHPIVA
jgi:hypothetical protein